MIKPDFNKYERIAGAFVLIAAVGVLALTAAVVVKKGWLATKIGYYTEVPTASGIHVGTKVHIFGLPAGWVESVELQSAGRVKVSFDILENTSTTWSRAARCRWCVPLWSERKCWN
ncbi:MAG: hypothetical protein CSA54_02545 [Gammaproteobacteria bacterium]|nr:MAG: hypothetical protein CSA54_02545 [Gammaproteobacteria bacterium]